VYIAASRRRATLALVLAAASWGIGTVISKQAVGEISPFWLLLVQLAASVAVLGTGLLVSTGGRPSSRLPSGSGGRALDRLGLLNPGAAYAMSLIGLSQITASLSVLLWAGEPLLILLLAWRWLREGITGRLLSLSLIAAGGMVLIVWTPGAGGQGFGIALTLAGVACCAVYSVLTRRLIGQAPSTLRVVLGQQVWALGLAVLLLLGSIVVSGTWAAPSASPGAWMSAVVSGLVYYAVAYGLYLSGLRHVPVSLAASAFYLIPVFGVAGGWAFLGERLEPAQWVGGAVVIACLAGIARSTQTPDPMPRLRGRVGVRSGSGRRDR